MKARYRDLTAKYKSCRFQPEELFSSRTLQTFFNKFTKKGKKAIARRHFRAAFFQFRLSVRWPLGADLLTTTIRELETPLATLYRRKGKERLVVPVPTRRNKKKSAGIQTLYNSRQQRRERDLFERIHQERRTVAGPAHQAPVRRQQSAKFSELYDERRNIDGRWR